MDCHSPRLIHTCTGDRAVDKWRFYQGLRNEWRWYQLNEAGQVIRASDQAFAELSACMANAADAGFDQHSDRVHAREGGTIGAS